MQRIAVFGAGAMGRGIAQIAALAGMKVAIFDRFDANPKLRLSAENDVWSGLFLTKGKDGKLFLKSREAVNRAFENIIWLESDEASLTELKYCDAVIEAIFEDIEVKRNLYHLIERNLDPDRKSLLLTNTSTIQIARLAGRLKYPNRFMGAHFFNPVPLMRPVELIPHDGTDQETILAAAELVRKIGKAPLLAPDLPGFVVNRIAIPMVIAFAAELEKDPEVYAQIDKAFTDGTWEGYPPALRIVNSLIERAKTLLEKDQQNCRVKLVPGKIDELMQLGINMPVGPLALAEALRQGEAKGIKFVMGPGQFCDLVGLDVAVDCCKMLKMQEPDQWEVPAILEARVRGKKLGRKTGQGFYEHEGKVSVNYDKSPDYIIVSYRGDVLSGSLVKNLKKVFLELKGKSVMSGGSVFKAVVLEVRAKGANIKEFPLGFRNANQVRETIQEWHGLVKAIRDLEVPVIAVVKDYALGGGYELALACDYIFAEEGAVVGLPEVGLGLLPGGGGTQNLPRRVGLAKACRMIIGAQKVKAEEPWVDLIIRKSSFDEKILDVELISKKDHRPLTASFGKEFQFVATLTLMKMLSWREWPASWMRAIDAIDSSVKDLDEGLKRESQAFVFSIQTRDAEEGIRAFLEKRKPKFIGK